MLQMWWVLLLINAFDNDWFLFQVAYSSFGVGDGFLKNICFGENFIQEFFFWLFIVKGVDVYLFVFVWFLIHMSNILSCVISCVCWDGKNRSFGHYTQTFQPVNCHAFGTINFYQLIPLLVFLTLLDGQEISGKQNLLALCSCSFFSWTGWNLMWCWSSSS